MKTIKNVFLLSIFVALVILVTSCEKDPIDPVVGPDPIDHPTPITIKPTIQLNITPSVDTIPYGDEIEVSWNITNAKYVKLNGEIVSLADKVKVQLFSDTTYEFIAINGDSLNTIKKYIIVGNWKTSMLGRLTYEKPWSIYGEKFIQNGEVIWDSYLVEDQMDDLYYFTKDGKVYFDTNSTGNLSNNPNDIWYFIDENHLFMTGDIFEVVKLTEDELVVQKDTEDLDGKPTKFRIEYHREL